LNVLDFRKVLTAALIAATAACGSGEAEQKGKNRQPPLVRVEPASTMRFVETIEAVGTANANEQVTLSAPVTERLVRLGFDDGSFVRKGQVIAVLAQGQESAQLAEAQARQREAQQQLSRIETLRQRGFATQSSLDTQVAAAAAARAQASEARASIGERVIQAPFSGYASLRSISPGAVVSSGTEIATISDISTIKLDFPVPETVLSAIRPGLTIEARSAAYPEQPFRGQIANIDPVIDPNTRAVVVRARLPNGDGRLKPGMLLTVGIETAPRMSLSVPELAVVGEGENRFVFVVGKDQSARRTQVRTGVRSNGRVEIVQGLKAGDRVVTDGVVKVTDGMKVRLAGASNAAPGPRNGPQGPAPAQAPEGAPPQPVGPQAPAPRKEG
jgi:membrane fusion protein (multidrug efflux system)